jgi:hypothetical protein
VDVRWLTDLYSVAVLTVPEAAFRIVAPRRAFCAGLAIWEFVKLAIHVFWIVRVVCFD